MILLDNQWWRLFESPIVVLFFLLTALSLSWPLISLRFTRRARGAAPAAGAAGR